MKNTESSIYDKGYDPIMQAGLVLALILGVTILGKLINAIGIMTISDQFPWTTATSFLLFFAIFNSVISLASKDLNQYWGRSMLSFAVLAAVSAGVAYFFSALSIEEIGPYKWIYFVLTFGYLVFLSILGFMKRIVDFAEREDWQAPRPRKK